MVECPMHLKNSVRLGMSIDEPTGFSVRADAKGMLRYTSQKVSIAMKIGRRSSYGGCVLDIQTWHMIPVSLEQATLPLVFLHSTFGPIIHLGITTQRLCAAGGFDPSQIKHCYRINPSVSAETCQSDPNTYILIAISQF